MSYTSDQKPSGLTPLTSLASDDTIIVGDTSDAAEVVKTITKANLVSDLADETQTLTNKTIDGNNNTISNLAIGAEVTGASTDLSDTAALTYNADTDVSTNGWVLDEDNMASNDATKVPTQQSVKAYVDSQGAGAVDVVSNVAQDRILGRVTAGSGDSEELTAAQVRTLINVEDGATTDQVAADVPITDGGAYFIGTEVETALQEVGSKLSGIEAGADVTDTDNVRTAGALMDDELTSITDVKALDQSVVSGASPTFTTTNFTDATNKRLLTDAQETLVDNALQNISEDTTPQLGGELDCGANSIGFTMQTATGDGTTTVDWGNGNHFDFTFGAFNETFTFTAPAKPGVYTMSLKQDSVGSRTATWPATVKWPGGTAPTLTTTATTGYDIISFRYDGTNYYAISTLDFS